MGLVWSYGGFLFGIDAPIFMPILLVFLLLSIGGHLEILGQETAFPNWPINKPCF